MEISLVLNYILGLERWIGRKHNELNDDIVVISIIYIWVIRYDVPVTVYVKCLSINYDLHINVVIVRCNCN